MIACKNGVTHSLCSSLTLAQRYSWGLHSSAIWHRLSG